MSTRGGAGGRGRGRGRGRGAGPGSGPGRFTPTSGASTDLLSGVDMKPPEPYPEISAPVQMQRLTAVEENLIETMQSFTSKMQASPYYLQVTPKVRAPSVEIYSSTAAKAMPASATRPPLSSLTHLSIDFFPDELQPILDPSRKTKRKVATTKKGLDLNALAGIEDGGDGDDDAAKGDDDDENPADEDADYGDEDDDGDYGEQYFDDGEGEGDEGDAGEAAF
ncbi:hypothetical protein GGF32_005757 [Allomyces javanicus]|nr:hypothetical protein GGF32_005757 [Allomyces javanicus]